MGKKSGISVVIITYNREKELERAVRSCLTQVEGLYEIIVIDQGKTDQTALFARIAEESGIVRIRYIRTGENLGVSGGRNRGFALAEQDYVLFLDDDAVIGRPISFGSCDRLFRENPSIAVLCANVYVPVYDLYMVPRRKSNSEALFFIGAGHILCRSRVRKKRLYPEALRYGHEDLLLSLQLYQRDRFIYFWDDFYVEHFPSTERMDFSEEKRNGIINKYLVKQRMFPIICTPIFLFVLFRRTVVFWKGDFKNITKTLGMTIERGRRLDPMDRLSLAQAGKLLEDYGYDFLWEISHNNKDRKEEKNGNRDEQESRDRDIRKH